MSFPFKYNYPQVARDSGFVLRNYKDGPLDWRLMGSVEVERILREQCLEQVDSVLEHLSEAPLGSMLETNILDGAIAKYFVLSQFSIQYLLFCRKFLEETVADLRETHGSSQMEVATLKRSLSESNNEILQLHKRITQMEAIHEVIYPCHLCTKNFVSNDALNLHISRKHNPITSKLEERTDTPVTSAKERGNDLTLINTIKLELEIKHLKERLNNAERKIKEKDDTPKSNLDTCRSPEKLSTKNTNSIGIQSNLSEIKEHDEQSEYDCKHCSENTGQIFVLQNKLQNLDEWKEEQRTQNAEFLAEISSKLKDLTLAMKITQNQQEESKGKVAPSTSLEDLDAILSRKIEDISTSTAAKLDYVVSKMELNYKNKLEDFEKELVKISKQTHKFDTPYENKHVPSNHKKASPHDETHDNKLKENFPNNPADNVPNNEKVMADEILPQLDSIEKSSSLSNQTFVKTKPENNLEKIYQGDHTQNNECTDVSDEILEDDDSESNTKFPKTIKIREDSDARTYTKPKPVTRNESRKLANARLSTLGVNMKTKSLTESSMKHISNVLSERRITLKEKHANFYATRNKIKKFVDKLCSSKMPEKAQALLKVTRPLRPNEMSTKHQTMSYTPSSDEDAPSLLARRNENSFTPHANSSHSVHNMDFKHRLESILASPIRKPDEHHVGTVIHHQQDKPIPMPRKRVMFNQQPDMKLDEQLSLSESESDHLPKQYHQKVHVHKAPM